MTALGIVLVALVSVVVLVGVIVSIATAASTLMIVVFGVLAAVAIGVLVLCLVYQSKAQVDHEMEHLHQQKDAAVEQQTKAQERLRLEATRYRAEQITREANRRAMEYAMGREPTERSPRAQRSSRVQSPEPSREGSGADVQDFLDRLEDLESRVNNLD